MACNCNNTSIDFIQETDKIIQEIGTEKHLVIPLLQRIQQAFNYLPNEVMQHIATKTEITKAQLTSVSTFYAQFRHMPSGDHTIKICTGTACHVKGANGIYDAFVRDLKINTENHTTPDMRFSIEKVACLGCCTLAPAVQIDEQTFGHVGQADVQTVIDEFIQNQGKQANGQEQNHNHQPMGEVRIGMGSCCMASGSTDIHTAITQACHQLNIHVNIKSVGCVGVCKQVPIVDILDDKGKITRYPNVQADEIHEILLSHFKSKNPIKRLSNKFFNFIDNAHTDTTWNNVLWTPEQERNRDIRSFLAKQKHISTEGYGQTDPLDIEDYQRQGGFEALKSVIDNTQTNCCETILNSGIRGRGGGGFPSGKKWEMVRNNPSKIKYIICNGDEGDPGAFMDRMLLESYPFRVLEGLLIAAYAVGAHHGIMYIRAEYPLAVQRINKAIELMKSNNLLGESILKSDFSIELEVFEGAGAFVCGEETALIASIEGDRGFPKQRPPYPVESGLYNAPTLVNNVETLSQVPYIFRHGNEHYRAIGTNNSPGTKVFALAGKIKNGGLIEVPMGITLHEIVEEIGGGIEDGNKLKAIQIGGPSGGCLPANLANTKVDFDELKKHGAMMGSGGLVVLDQNDCMVDMARYFLTFTCDQSCGKCTFCRVGIAQMLQILETICEGKATLKDLDTLEDLAHKITQGSLCGLGRTAPNPVLTTLKYFRDEYLAHINGQCPAKKCEALIEYSINDDCFGCTKCAKVCPVDAIDYRPYEKHTIDTVKCIKCGLCIDECSVQSIHITDKSSMSVTSTSQS